MCYPELGPEPEKKSAIKDIIKRIGEIWIISVD